MARDSLRQATERRASRNLVVFPLIGRLRNEVAVIATLIALVILTSFALSAAPRLLNSMSDDALRESMSTGFAGNRNMSIEQGMRIPPADGPEPFAPVAEQSEQFLEELPEELGEIVGDQQFVINSPQYQVQSLPNQPAAPFPRFLRFRQQQDVDAQIDLVEGRMPEPAEPREVQIEEDGPAEELPVFEIAVTQATADELRLGLGDSSILSPNTDDPLYRGIPRADLEYDLLFEIVGIFEGEDPEAEYWFDDSRLLEPVIVESADFVLIFAEGLLAPSAYEGFLADTEPALWNYTFRYFVDPDRVDTGEVDALVSDIRRAEVTYGSGSFSAVDEPTFRTGLVRIIDRFLGQRQLTISILSMAVVGVLALAAAVTWILAVLIADRRRPATTLIRSRGASGWQMLATAAVEGLIVSVPAAALGFLLASLVVPGRPGLLPVLALAIVIMVTAILYVLGGLPDARRTLGELIGGPPRVEDVSRRRIVIELGFVALAVAAVVLYRRRGLEAGSLTNPDVGFDPFLAMMPVLLTLALGVLILRIYPLAARVLAWLGSLTRTLTTFVGFRRVAWQPLTARLPIVVLLLAVAIAVFSGILEHSIDEGQRESTWHQVGADYRIESPEPDAPLSRFADLSDIEEIEASADAHYDPNVRVSSIDTISGNISLLAIDTAGYQDVTAETRVEANLPDSMIGEQLIQDIGTESNPIPAVASSTWVDRADLGPGDQFELVINRIPAVFILRDVRDKFAGLDENEQVVVMSLTSLRNVDREASFPTTRRYFRAPADAHDVMLGTLRERSPGTDFISRGQLYNELAEAPLVSGARIGFFLILFVAGIYAALAVVSALALTAPDRTRDFGYLRTLGLSSGQAVIMTIVEQLPPVVIASLFGTALGFALVRIVEPGIELTVFTGEGLTPQIVLDWTTIGLLVGGLMVTVAIAVALFSYATRQVNLGNVLRVGDQ